MATTVRKKSSRKTGSKSPHRAKLTASKKGALFEVQDGQLIVRLSRGEHPEVFETDKLMKSMTKIIETYGSSRNCSDLVEFLEETQKSLEILLRNHLEDAMRKYLK